MGFFSFEDKIDVINELLWSRRRRWYFVNISGLDFDDVCQNIRIHISKKWHLYDQSRPLERWVNRIISNQISNLIKAHYLKYAPPCAQCASNQGGSFCSFTKSGEKCNECPLYKKWSKSKADGFNLKTPEPITQEHILISSKPNFNIDWGKSIDKMNTLLKDHLPENLYQIYEDLYVNGVSEEDLAKKLGFKTSEANKSAGYKQIYNFKKEIMKVAKEVAKECL